MRCSGIGRYGSGKWCGTGERCSAGVVVRILGSLI